LFALAWTAGPVMNATIVIGVAYLIMMAGLPVRRAGAYLMGAVLAWGVLYGDRAGVWWTERGWALLVAGWFVALTLRHPESGFLSRALASLAGAAGVAAVVISASGRAWPVLDFQMGERVRLFLTEGLSDLLQRVEAGAVSPALVTGLYAIVDAQIQILPQVFPAMLALGTLAALAVAWWLYVRMAHGDDQGLLPLREFRFNDQLVWLFIGGLAAALLGVDAWKRAGANAVVFMSALYALRGAAVASFFGAGQSALGMVLLALGLVLVGPVMMVAALVIGLGDTWLDLRGRARALTA
jgi:hypothetical protein